MPPGTRITREMIVDAALEVVRQSGLENVNARTVAKELGCSTQPVMYRFATVEELKRAAYARLDRMHTAYLLSVPPERDPLPEIGLNYIRFAVEEPNWFRFLLQSGYAAQNSLSQMLDAEELQPILGAMRRDMDIPADRTKDVFMITAMFVHGCASMIANNALEYDEAAVARQLERAFIGAVLAVREEEANESHFT